MPGPELTATRFVASARMNQAKSRRPQVLSVAVSWASRRNYSLLVAMEWASPAEPVASPRNTQRMCSAGNPNSIAASGTMIAAAKLAAARRGYPQYSSPAPGTIRLSSPHKVFFFIGLSIRCGASTINLPAVPRTTAQLSVCERGSFRAGPVRPRKRHDLELCGNSNGVTCANGHSVGVMSTSASLIPGGRPSTFGG